VLLLPKRYALYPHAPENALTNVSLQGEEDTVVSDITRALIKSLPRLFAKHQTDEARIAVVLSIPLLMNLDLYVEMRMTAVGRVIGISSAKG